MMKATLLFILIVVLSSFSGNTHKNSDQAQITFQNNTQYDLCLFLDNGNNLVCGPAPANGGVCVASVESGTHVLIVATVDGNISTSTNPVDINPGDTKIVTAATGNDGSGCRSTKLARKAAVRRNIWFMESPSP